LILVSILPACQDASQTQNSQTDALFNTTETIAVKQIGLADMKWFLDEIANQELDRYVADYGFHKRANGIYISNEMVTAKKPKHWLKFMEMGEFSNVSFMTVDRHLWDALIAELTDRASPEGFQEASDTKAERYQFDGYIVET